MRRVRFVLLILVGMGALAAGCGKVTVNADAKPSGPDAPSANAPTLTSIAPTSGIVTTHVTLTGTHFGATQTGSSVTIGGSSASIVSWSDTSVVVSVPSIFPGDAPVMITTPDGSAGPQTFHVILPPMVYVHNDATESDTFDSVTAMSFDPNTGALNAVSGPISIGDTDSSYGGCSQSIWVNEKTRRLFVTGTTAVAVFDIDPVTGGLTKVPGSPFKTGASRGFGVVTNAAGTRVFAISVDRAAGDSMSNVAVFDVGSTGALTAVAGSPFVLGMFADTVGLSSTETNLVANSWGGTFGVWAVSSAGAITTITGNTPVNAGAPGFDRRPGTDMFYFPNQSGPIAAYTVSASGVPTALGGSPFTFANPGGNPETPTFTSDGNRMYIGSRAQFVQGFNLASTGVPTAIAGSPWNVGGTAHPNAGISCVAVSKDGAHLIAVDENESLVFSASVDANGVPAAVSGSPFANPSTVANASGVAMTF